MTWVIDGLKGHWRSLEPPTCMIGCIFALLVLMRWWGQNHRRNLDCMLLKLYLSEAGSPVLIQQRDGSSPASAWWVCAGPPVGLCRSLASSSSGPSGPQRHLSWCWCSDLQESQGFMEASVPTRVGWSMTISHTWGGGDTPQSWPKCNINLGDKRLETLWANTAPLSFNQALKRLISANN